MMPLTAPPGVRVVGNSAEWIVERPMVDGVLSTLADYSSVNFTKAVAWSGLSNAGVLSLRSFALRSGFPPPASARTIATSLNFPLPVSLRVLISEAAVVLAGSGQTVAMDENGVPVSFADIEGSEALRCQYFGLQPGKLGSGGPPLNPE